MQRIQLQEDIQPLSEFRSKVAFYLEKVNKNKRPLIITQNGKSAGILIGVSEYDSLIEKLEVLEDIKLAESDISKGSWLTNSAVKKRFDKRIK